MTKRDTGKSFYTTHTAAKKLLVTPTTIIQWIKDGKIKTMKTLGQHRRIPAKEIDRIWEEMDKDFNKCRPPCGGMD